MEKKGIRFILNANVQSVTNVEKGTTLTYKDTTSSELNTLKADAILLATGRKPNTENLNLKAAGVEVNERGAIIADEHLKTTTLHIRVMGERWFTTHLCFSGRLSNHPGRFIRQQGSDDNRPGTNQLFRVY